MTKSTRAHDHADSLSVKPTGEAADRILSAATIYFQRYGYEGTSIARIARAAGMTPANIYWHFPSKMDLLAAVLHSLYQNSYDVLCVATRSGSATERLSAYVRTYVTTQLTEFDEDRNFGYASLASSLNFEEQQTLRAAGRPYLELVGEILQQGTESGEFVIRDLTVASYALSNMCEYSFTWFRPEGRLSAAQVAEEYVSLVLNMVRPEQI